MSGSRMAGGDDDFLIDPQAMARAEAALQRLSSEYLGWARADQAALEAHLAALPTDQAARRRLFEVAHNMKGQAGTFGYPLVTELANRLCRRIEAGTAPEALAPLVTALRRVLDEELSGDGGAAGRELLKGL